MKKLLLGLAMTVGTLSFAQYQSTSFGNGGYGNYDGYNNSYNNDNYYFPDEYYYDFPKDYYAENYYQSYYNDYRNSIVMINWNDFFRRHRLSSWQVQQIMMLNDMYSSYASWNSYYRYNPDRWYFDRFYSLQQIMGPQIFIVYQNNYYNGYHPISYFQNYRQEYYVPRYRVTPRYRNVNINIYRLDRNRFVEKHGNKYGWSETRNPHNSAGVRQTTGRRDGTGIQSQPVRNNPALRNGSQRAESSVAPRTASPATGVRNTSAQPAAAPRGAANGSIQGQRTPTRAMSPVTEGTSGGSRNISTQPSPSVRNSSGNGQRGASPSPSASSGSRGQNSSVRGGSR